MKSTAQQGKSRKETEDKKDHELVYLLSSVFQVGLISDTFHDYCLFITSHLLLLQKLLQNPVA